MSEEILPLVICKRCGASEHRSKAKWKDFEYDSYGISRGKRIVCRYCAIELDRQEAEEERQHELKMDMEREKKKKRARLGFWKYYFGGIK